MAGYATTKNPSKAYKLNEDDATEEEAGRGTEELDGMQLQIDLDSQQFTTSSRSSVISRRGDTDDERNHTSEEAMRTYQTSLQEGEQQPNDQAVKQKRGRKKKQIDFNKVNDVSIETDE